jgi:hypothetical protein
MAYNNFRFSSYDLLIIGKTPIPIIPSVIGVLKTNITTSYIQDIDFGYKKEIDVDGKIIENSDTYTQYVKQGNNQVTIDFVLGTGGSGISNFTTPLVRVLKGIASLMGVIKPEMLAKTTAEYLKPNRKDTSKLYKASYYSMEGLFIKDYDIISVNESQNLESNQIVFNLVLQESQQTTLETIKESGAGKVASNYIKVGNANRILSAG